MRTFTKNSDEKPENHIQIVGSGTIIFEPKLIRGGSYIGHIEDIVVDEQYRCKGIATRIIENLIEFAKEKKCYKVILDCQNEKSGFDNHGIQMTKYFNV